MGGQPVARREGGHARGDAGVGDRRVAAETLCQHGGPGIGDGVGRVLGIPLVGVGVAGLDDQGDAADEGHHRHGGDDDDLPARGAPRVAGSDLTHGDLVHGCLGQAAAAAASVWTSGQLYSTTRTDWASKVTPLRKTMFEMNGVIGL